MCCSSLVSSGTCSWAKRKKKARKSPRSRGAARRVPRPFYSFPHCLSRAWRDRVVKAVSLGILRCFQAHIALLLRCSWSPGTDHFFFYLKPDRLYRTDQPLRRSHPLNRPPFSPRRSFPPPNRPCLHTTKRRVGRLLPRARSRGNSLCRRLDQVWICGLGPERNKLYIYIYLCFVSYRLEFGLPTRG